MKKNAVDYIEQIALKLKNQPEAVEFLKRLKESDLTRDENPQSHFCVYFAAYDPGNKLVFMGHHKKSGRWLFNGGHIDKGETPLEALTREIGEEWGKEVKFGAIAEPTLITITPISNPMKQKCETHFDIWYFVPVSKSDFLPDKEKLAEEFFVNSWLDVTQARNVVTDPNNLTAIARIEELFGP